MMIFAVRDRKPIQCEPLGTIALAVPGVPDELHVPIQVICSQIILKDLLAIAAHSSHLRHAEADIIVVHCFSQSLFQWWREHLVLSWRSPLLLSR